MLYFVMQNRYQTWTGYLAYAVLWYAMLLSWNGNA
jgi:hypothetical protein